jgi:S-adenosylmethionine uptake transporter
LYSSKFRRPWAIGFFLLALLICATGDVLGKVLVTTLPAAQLTFLRFATSLVVLLPFVGDLHRSELMKTHILRGAILCLATQLWVLGVSGVPLTTATAINFSVPLFTLPIAYLVLRERPNRNRMLAALVGFLGVLVATQPTGGMISEGAYYLILASVCYAALDVVNKGSVSVESPLNMVFYSSVFGTLFSAYSAATVWQWPTGGEWVMIWLFGITANLVLHFMVKAFQLEEVTLLSPFHYVELLFTTILSLAVFGDLPTVYTIAGAAIIVAATVVAAFFDSRSPVSA